MRDILSDVERWRAQGKRIAIATVVQTWGSAPRRAGSKLGLASDGQFSGSVSGGCVENAVIESGLEVLKTNRPQLLHFGVADETARDVGLACGGSIDIFVQPLDEIFYNELRSVIEAEQQAVLATIIRGSDEVLGRALLHREDEESAGDMPDTMRPKVLELTGETFSTRESRRAMLDDETELFFEFIAPSPTLIAVGGVHITVALVALAKTLGYQTVVIDPRRAWGSAERFPNADRLIQAWPDKAFEQVKITRSTAVAMLTHDPKLDDPAVKIALNSPAFYVGALGSKATNAKRRARLLDNGISEEQYARLHAPIGMDIGAGTPEEIALAIMSEVVAAYRKREQVPAAREANLHSVKN